MKNYRLFQINKSLGSIQVFFKITVVLLFISHSGFSQKTRTFFGTSITSSFTGSGFGIQYSPNVFCKAKNRNIELGLLIQQRNCNVSGLRINYEYTVFDGENLQLEEEGSRKLELFFFSSVLYNHSANLSSTQIKLERSVSRNEVALEYDKFIYKAIESYSGFGLRIKLSNKLKWVNSIGVGGWLTLVGEKKLERGYNSLGLLLNTKLSYQFGRR